MKWYLQYVLITDNLATHTILINKNFLHRPSLIMKLLNKFFPTVYQHYYHIACNLFLCKVEIFRTTVLLNLHA